MSNIVVVNDYKVDCVKDDAETIAVIIKYLETFYEVTEQYEGIKFEYEKARLQLEMMCEKAHEEIGFKSIKGRYDAVTFVPGTEGRTETRKVMSESKVKAIMNELGIDESEYMVTEEKTIGGRKASIRYKQ